MRLLTIIMALFLATAFNITTNLHAQDVNELSSSELRSILNSDRIPVKRAVNTEGSPYLFEEFYEGTVSLQNGHQTKPLPIRYNTHEQSLDFMSNGSAFNLDGEQIKSFEFTIGEDRYLFRKGYEGSRLDEDEFVQVLVDGEITFIARHETSFFENAASYGTATQQDRYRSNVTYYIKLADQEPNRLRTLSKRRVMRSIDQYKDQVEAFGDEQSVDFSEAQDVTRLLEYYNSLLEEEK